MQTRNKTTAWSNQHQAENLTNDPRSSPSRANPQASPPKERRKGKDPIIEDQSGQVHTNGAFEAPVTQAQLAEKFRAIMNATRLQAPNQVPGGTPSHASTSRRSRPGVSRRPV